MSKIVKGVIDLPTIDYRDLEGLYETALFILEQGQTKRFQVKKTDEFLYITSGRSWEWVKIYNDGRLEYDRHYGEESDQWREAILKALAKHYPQVKKALELLKKANIKAYSLNYNKETEELLIEAEI